MKKTNDNITDILENKIYQLKKELAKVLKEKQRLQKEVDKYQNYYIDNTISSYVDIKEKEQEEREEKERLYRKWECFECGKGVLQIHTYHSMLSHKYYRKCNICDSQTKSKVFTEDVTGIFFSKLEK